MVNTLGAVLLQKGMECYDHLNAVLFDVHFLVVIYNTGLILRLLNKTWVRMVHDQVAMVKVYLSMI